MKKVLSVILALSMFSMPSVAMSCFADGGRNYRSAAFNEELKGYGLEKVQIIADVSEDRPIAIHAIFFGQRGKFFKASSKLPDEIYKSFVKEIDNFKILDQMRSLNCSFAKVVFERDIKSNVSVYATFYDAQGRYVNLINYFLT